MKAPIEIELPPEFEEERKRVYPPKHFIWKWRK
jgi:hypothetical protein